MFHFMFNTGIRLLNSRNNRTLDVKCKPLNCTQLITRQNERDLSVRQRAVDLLYAMCDREPAEEIVGELLAYLEKADYSIREELV